MAISGSFNTGTVGNFYFTFSWQRTGYDSAANKHYVSWSLVAHNTAGYYRTVYYKNLVINGTTVFSEPDESSSGKAYYDGNVVASGSITINSSNSAGDGSISASFSAGVGIYHDSPNCSGSGSWTLDRIPRYATVTQSAGSKTINSTVMTWSSDSVVDYVWYSINNGSTWVAVGTAKATSGSYTIQGLAPNTTYNIKTKVRRKDSQLESSVATATAVTTYNKATISSAPNFIHGNGVTITYSNPGSASLTIKIGNAADTVSYTAYKDCSGSSYTFSFTAAELDNIYKTYGNNSTTSVRVWLRSSCNGTAYWDYKDVTVTLKGDQRTAWEKASGTWRRGKVWIKISGTWRRGVVWEKVNGTWRRGI